MSKEVSTKPGDVTPKDVTPKKEGFIKKASHYWKDLKSEAKKIVWPTKKQVYNNTIVVLVFMGISAVVLWSLDWAFINLFKLIYK